MDTNVILSDPKCIYKFENNDVHIPLIVIEELDRHKKGHEELARNARAFSRDVDELRAQGSLATGVKLHNGGTLFITSVSRGEVPLGMDLSINDDLILFTALQLDAICVSKDLNVRLKADGIGVVSEDYKADKFVIEDDSLNSGYASVEFSNEDMTTYRDNKFLAYEGNFPNEYYIMTEFHQPKNSALGKYDALKGGIVPLIGKTGVWGIQGKNAEQRFALDALCDNNVKLVSLVGKAGTGKTLLAIAAALKLTIEDSKYERILISRPVVAMGKDIGFLPGTLEEKLDPWMAPIFDSLDHLFGSHGINKEWKTLINKGIIKIEALTYIRGRSIPRQLMIIDESQNLSAHEIKTIITRAGEGTKIILTGDPQQIDNVYLDEINNGLVYCIDRMKGEKIVSHIELTKGERSELADIASNLL